MGAMDQIVDAPAIAALEVGSVQPPATDSIAARCVGIVRSTAAFSIAAPRVSITALLAATFWTRISAAAGDPGQLFVDVLVNDAEIARIVPVALAADEFAVFDVVVVADPNWFRGASAAAARLGRSRVWFGVVLSLPAPSLPALLLAMPLGQGTERTGQWRPGQKRRKQSGGDQAPGSWSPGQVPRDIVELLIVHLSSYRIEASKRDVRSIPGTSSYRGKTFS
jgi:hypothetical protein